MFLNLLIILYTLFPIITLKYINKNTNCNCLYHDDYDEFLKITSGIIIFINILYMFKSHYDSHQINLTMLILLEVLFLIHYYLTFRYTYIIEQRCNCKDHAMKNVLRYLSLFSIIILSANLTKNIINY